MTGDYSDQKDFLGPVSEKHICNAEENLGLKFPQSYLGDAGISEDTVNDITNKALNHMKNTL